MSFWFSSFFYWLIRLINFVKWLGPRSEESERKSVRYNFSRFVKLNIFFLFFLFSVSLEFGRLNRAICAILLAAGIFVIHSSLVWLAIIRVGSFPLMVSNENHPKNTLRLNDDTIFRVNSFSLFDDWWQFLLPKFNTLRHVMSTTSSSLFAALNC